MNFGVFMFVTDFSIGVVELARQVEAAGFESLWLGEHTHIPASRESPWPGGPDLPREYWHMLDPFVALGAAAAATTRLKLGTGVCLVAEHDPIILAKQVATVDLVSNGRFLFGTGGGWNLEEAANHGTKPSLRWKILRERILAMKQIWVADQPEFHGEHVNFDPIWSWPKPVQKPHPPIVVGGNGPRTLERVVEYGDEWGPIVGRGPRFEGRIGELQERARAAGRGTIPVTAFFARPDPEVIEGYQAAGVSRCVFSLPSAGPDEVLPRIEALAGLAARFQ